MYFRYVLSEVFRRRSRTVEIVLTVAVLVSLLISVTAVMDAYSAAVYAPFRNVGADLILQKGGNTTVDPALQVRSPFGKTSFTPVETKAIASLGNIRNMSESLVVWSFRKDGFSTVEGVDPASPIGMKLGSWVTTGSFLVPQQNNSAVLESHFARFNHLEAGDSVDLGGESFRVVGILKVIEGSQVFSSNVYVNLADARRISHIDGSNQIYLQLDNVADEDGVRDAIQDIDTQIIVYSGSGLASSLGNVAELFRQFYLIIIGAVIGSAVFILAKMTVAGLLEKRKDIGVMQSVGWTRQDILVQLIAEFSLKAIAGCIAGVGIAFLVIAAIGSVSVQSRPRGLGEPIVVSAPLSVSQPAAVGYVLLVFFICLAISYVFIRRFVAAKPSENMRSL